jgi:molybdate transport system regulatory protein
MPKTSMQPGHVIKIHIRVEDNEQNGIGEGRIELLRLIDQHGSLNRAAASLRMSYRAAWGAVKRAEQIMNIALVEPQSNKRKGSQLTQAGRELVAAFTALHKELEAHADRLAPEFFASLRKTIRAV